MVPGKFVIVYIPRGNAERVLEVVDFDGDVSTAKWIDPRNGDVIEIGDFDGLIPERSDPVDEDWILVVENPL
jgi:hypothetical protein